MSSQDFKFAGQGMFHQLDEKLAGFREKKSDPQVNGRYELMLSTQWASNDCQLDGLTASQMEKAIENHQNATALLMSKPDGILIDCFLILDVHSMMMNRLSEEAGEFRAGTIAPLSVNHEPPDPTAIKSAILNLLEWASADSFLELHPVQQMALVLVRLLDIYPFTDGTPRTSRVVANHYLMRAGFPPAIFLSREAALYEEAIEAGLAMDTTKLTARIVDSIGRTLDYCLSGRSESPET